MSQRAAASDQFVPYAPVGASTAKPSPATGGLRVVPKAEGGSTFSPMQMPGLNHHHGSSTASSTPVVTLQREGERVTGIRIECGCGQVIELACSY
jgi:hypothetical protein